MTVVGCNKIPCPWKSEPAGFLRSQLHDQVYVVKRSGSPGTFAESSSKVSVFHFSYCYLYFLYDAFVYFPRRDQALLLKSIFVVFTSFTIGIKNVILFDPENVSSRLHFKPQSGKLSCGIILHLYTNEKKMILSELEDEGLLPVAVKKYTKATLIFV